MNGLVLAARDVPALRFRWRRATGQGQGRDQRSLQKGAQPRPSVRFERNWCAPGANGQTQPCGSASPSARTLGDALEAAGENLAQVRAAQDLLETQRRERKERRRPTAAAPSPPRPSGTAPGCEKRRTERWLRKKQGKTVDQRSRVLRDMQSASCAAQCYVSA